MPRSFSLFVSLYLCLVTTKVSAKVLVVDPGPIGTVTGELTFGPYDYGDFTESTSLLFADGKSIEYSVFAGIEFRIRDVGGSPSGGNFRAAQKLGIYDENLDRQLLLEKPEGGIASTTEGAGAIINSSNAELIRGMFHEYSPDIGPINPDATITFTLFGQSDSLRIVPEPSSMCLAILFAIALLPRIGKS